MPIKQSDRTKTPSESLDGIYILGKGAIVFDNLPLTFNIESYKKQNPENKRFIVEQKSNNILMLFLYLTEQINGIGTDVIELQEYYSKIYVGESKEVLWTT